MSGLASIALAKRRRLSKVLIFWAKSGVSKFLTFAKWLPFRNQVGISLSCGMHMRRSLWGKETVPSVNETTNALLQNDEGRLLDLLGELSAVMQINPAVAADLETFARMKLEFDGSDG